MVCWLSSTFPNSLSSAQRRRQNRVRLKQRQNSSGIGTLLYYTHHIFELDNEAKFCDLQLFMRLRECSEHEY